MSRAHRWLSRLAISTLTFVVCAFVAELGFRAHEDGIGPTLRGLTGSLAVPYSDLGTDNWVVYDEHVGYRLNPDRSEVHDTLSVRQADVVVPKPEGLHRILVLGDSVPYDPRGFVTRIREALADRPDVEVVNGGVPGYTSYQEVLFYERYLAAMEPDVVLWTYCLNDNHRFLHQFDPRGRMLVTDEAREALTVRTAWDRVVSRSRILTRARLRAHVRAGKESSSRFPWDNRPDFSIAWKDHSWSDYEGDMRRLLELLGDVPLAVVVFPFEPQLLRWRPEDREYVLKPQVRLRDLCAEYGVPRLDLYPVFRPHYDRPRRERGALYRDGVHLNDRGHDLATEAILAFLDRQGLLPPE